MHRRVRHLNPGQCGAQVALDSRYITGVADGAALATWPARANTTIGATATGVNQPIYRASSINGRPAVEFDGADDFMNLDAGALSLTSNVPSCSINCVLIQTGGADAQQQPVSLSVNGSANPRAFLLARFASNSEIRSQGRRLDADSTSATASAGSSASACIATSRQDYTANAHSAGRNGVFTVSTTYSSGAGNTSATNSNLARIGAQSAAASRLGGRIAAVIIAAPMLSAPVANRVRQHLGFSFRIATT